jgi:hypothetical protein
VEWWAGPDGLPLQVEARKEDVRVSVTLGDYRQLQEVEPLTFTVPDDFAIEAGGDGAPEGLPRL